MAQFITPEERVMKAIFYIRPKAEFSVALTYDTLRWLDDTQVKPTEKEFNDALKNFDANEYQRSRASEYPSIPDQLDEIYHNGINAWKAVIKQTKDKYPKG